MVFILFDFILYVPVNNFSVMSGRLSLGLTSTKQWLMCFAQGHQRGHKLERSRYSIAAHSTKIKMRRSREGVAEGADPSTRKITIL